ncbi:6-bladed beta-propeller [Verrucomicrobia bacterium]|nr:6-bladed beta-propeller [Verrucomicrobiota bacterium]
MNRRSFLAKATFATAATSLSAPFVYSQSKTSYDGHIVGHGDFKYRVDTKWSKADSKTHPVRDCHEMVQSKDGRLFLLTNDAKNNVLVYNTDGTLVDSWTLKLNGAHGLTIDQAEGKEHLYITDTKGRVLKSSLDGEIHLELPLAKDCGAYSATSKYAPTETAVGPNGDIYVADGYGSQYILHFDSTGRYLKKFGGKSTQPVNKGKFMQAHGVALDTRGTEPLLVCTARIRNEFVWFDLNGKHRKTIYLPGAFVSRPVIHGDNLYSGICFGAYENDYRMWVNRGFVTVLDKNDNVVSNPGGKAPAYKNGKVTLMLQDIPLFKNCHDVCVDSEQNLYVCQWNANKVYPYKLTRV